MTTADPHPQRPELDPSDVELGMSLAEVLSHSRPTARLAIEQWVAAFRNTDVAGAVVTLMAMDKKGAVDAEYHLRHPA